MCNVMQVLFPVSNKFNDEEKRTWKKGSPSSYRKIKMAHTHAQYNNLSKNENGSKWHHDLYTWKTVEGQTAIVQHQVWHSWSSWLCLFAVSRVAKS